MCKRLLCVIMSCFLTLSMTGIEVSAGSNLAQKGDDTAIEIEIADENDDTNETDLSGEDKVTSETDLTGEDEVVAETDLTGESDIDSEIVLSDEDDEDGTLEENIGMDEEPSEGAESDSSEDGASLAPKKIEYTGSEVYYDGIDASFETFDPDKAPEYFIDSLMDYGKKISTKPNGKPLVLIFFKTGCWNCESVLEDISGASFSIDVDCIAAEMSGASPVDAIDFINNAGASDTVQYGYNAKSVCWSYYRSLGGGNSLKTPLIVYLSKNGDIKGYTTSYVNIYDEIKNKLGVDAHSKTYTVKYMPNEKSVWFSQKYGIGHMCCIASPKTKEGYIFKNWNTKPDGTGKTYFEGEHTPSLTMVPDSVVNLYAQWDYVKYKITYNLNGGTNNSKNPTYYTVETPTFKLAAPSRAGYTFGGWYSDKDFKTKVTEIRQYSKGKITLYAKWTLSKYKIQFVGNGATSGSTASMTGCKGNTTYNLTANGFKRTGYKFKGWNTKADGSGKSYANKAAVKNLTSKNGATVKLYAQWSIVKYTITYNLNKGTNNASNPAQYTIASETITFKKPTRKGYTFKGWYTDSEFKTKITEIPAKSTGNVTVYAKWAVNKYSITFNGNGATSGSVASQKSLKYSTSYTLNANAFKKKGYKFIEWNTKADGSGTSFADKATVKALSSKNGATVTLYAIWHVNKYNIAFNGNGATSGSMSKLSGVKYGSSVSLKANAFTRKGYVFAGWNTKADGSGKTYADKAKVKNLSSVNGKTITLYAMWEKSAKK